MKRKTEKKNGCTHALTPSSFRFASSGHFLEDAWEGPPDECTLGPAVSSEENGASGGSGSVDILCVDFGVGARLEEFLRVYWRCVAPGGLVVIHSTLTNEVTRKWLERVRRGEVDFGDFDDNAGGGSSGGSGGKKRKKGDAAAASGGGGGRGGGGGGGASTVHHISLLEPHKRYQNAFTILQKRSEGWGEPLYTEEA